MGSGWSGGIHQVEWVCSSRSGLFNKLIVSSCVGLANHTNVVASLMSFICHKRRKFCIDHLPFYFPEARRRNLLFSSTSFNQKLFDESLVSDLFSKAQTSSSLKSQQSLVDIAKNLTRSRSPTRSPKSYKSSYRRDFSRQSRSRSERSQSRSLKRARFSTSSSSG